MSVMLLKKYTVRELRSAEEDARRGFSFFVAAGGMALPVGQEQLPTVFNNASVIHGFLSVPFPLPVSCKVRHEDFQGVIRFDLTFEHNPGWEQIPVMSYEEELAYEV